MMLNDVSDANSQRMLHHAAAELFGVTRIRDFPTGGDAVAMCSQLFFPLFIVVT